MNWTKEGRRDYGRRWRRAHPGYSTAKMRIYRAGIPMPSTGLGAGMRGTVAILGIKCRVNLLEKLSDGAVMKWKGIA